MNRITDVELVKLEGEELGLDINDADARAVLEMWRTAPLSSLRDILVGISNLNESTRQARLRRFYKQWQRVNETSPSNETSQQP